MKSVLGTLTLFLGFLTICWAQEQNSTAEERGGKALSVFQVVRFPNSVCAGTGSQNGTCYTSSECTNKGGTSAGSCANGFGVCCTFTLGCGSKIAENCTYFTSASTVASGACGVTICKCSSDICQIRLDFNTFVITGPSTSATTSFFSSNGAPALGGGKASTKTQCLTDVFTVTGAGSNAPPVCGTLSGSHMYVEIDDRCSKLDFQLGTTAIGATLATRSWNIKISQYSCYDPNLPPAGCTQWFTGTSGVIQSYNFANSVELANQKQNICMRQERNYCSICYATSATSDFMVSGMTAMGFHMASKCCGYGSKGTKVTSYGGDCLIIPMGMSSKFAAANDVSGSAYCGKSFFGYAKSAAAATTVCTKSTPFLVQFMTDGLTGGTVTTTGGFRLYYVEKSC